MTWKMIPENLKKLLIKQKYYPVGKHSAVKLCHWLKEALKNGRFCYKQKFYGIKTHRCLQMSPAVVWCDLRCLHCWRPSESMLDPSSYRTEDLDDPETIVLGSIEAQRKAIGSYKGLVEEGRIDKKLFEEAMNPNQVAISLIGEPTLYPYLDELVHEYKKRSFSTFVVTNGCHPEYLEHMEHYPTNLYISILSTNQEQFRQIQNPYDDPGKVWQRFLRSIELMSELRETSVNTVFRITLIKGINDNDLDGLKRLIELGQPKFVEVKAYMPVGLSQNRLGRDYAPSHQEVKDFALKLSEVVSYDYKDEVEASRVVLLVG